jgi:hypothetical protein
MTHELRMKKRNMTLDDFREFLTDCILIYEGAVVVVLLHELVPSNRASEIRMAMFGHRFYYNNYVPTMSGYKPCMYPFHFLDFFPSSNPFSFTIFF